MFIHSCSAIAFIGTSNEGKISPRQSTAGFKKRSLNRRSRNKDEINLAVQSRSLVPVMKGIYISITKDLNYSVVTITDIYSLQSNVTNCFVQVNE